VFDADARLPNLLRQVLPLFERGSVGRCKCESDRQRLREFLTQGQVAEMAVDTYIQQQRVALGGIAENCGNGRLSGERRCVAAYGMRNDYG